MPDLSPPSAITADRFRLFAPRSDYMSWAPALGREARRVGINTPVRVCAWLGQLCVECQGFTRFEEDLNYRTPARLDAVFSAVRGEADAADLISRGPRAIANRVYCGRGGNGSEASGDGWRFRGQGPLMTTFRGNFEKASRWTGLDLIAHPELILIPANGAKVAADYWRVCDLNDEPTAATSKPSPMALYTAAADQGRLADAAMPRSGGSVNAHCQTSGQGLTLPP